MISSNLYNEVLIGWAYTIAMENVEIIGMVKEGKFFPFEAKTSVEVTEIDIVAAQVPSPMDLSEHEGKVIMISGQREGGEGGKVWSSRIIDVASPILTVIARRFFNK